MTKIYSAFLPTNCIHFGGQIIQIFLHVIQTSRNWLQGTYIVNMNKKVMAKVISHTIMNTLTYITLAQ
jgi:hypothetical protein